RLGRPLFGLDFLRPPSLRQCVVRSLKADESTSKERRTRARELLKDFDLDHQAREPLAALSGGERRRAEIAVAVASGPSFIGLDEPFAGVDPRAQEDLHAVVRGLGARGYGVLISGENIREMLPLTTRSYVIHDGRMLAHGRPDELVR